MIIVDKIKNEINVRRIKFEQLSNNWLAMKKGEIKESSYANYSYFLQKYWMPNLGNLTIKELEEFNFNQIISELNIYLSPKTVRDCVSILKAILYYAEQEYSCNMRIRKIVGPKLHKEPLLILNKREKNKLEKHCLELNTLKLLGIIISLNTGIRIGEMCALKWKNIDLDKREIRIRNTLERIYSEKEKKTKVIIDTPKSITSTRNIPITDKIYSILIKLKKLYKPEDFFLTGKPEKFIEPRNYQSTFKKILKESKIRKAYTFHILRHTFATNCIEVGMDIKSLSEVLGHANVEITLNKYVHSSYKRKKKFLEKL